MEEGKKGNRGVQVGSGRKNGGEMEREGGKRREKESNGPLLHYFHAKHLAEAVILHIGQCLGQNIGGHVLHSYELEDDGPILYTFPYEVVSHLNMLCCRVVDRVLCEQVCSAVVDVEGGGSWNVLTEL